MTTKRIIAIMAVTVLIVSSFIYFVLDIEVTPVGLIIAAIGLGIAYLIPTAFQATGAGEKIGKAFKFIGKILFKSLFTIVIFSIVLVLVIFYALYEFNVTVINVSNAFFIVGLLFISPGVIIVTNAGSLFSGVNYVAIKMFSRSKNNDANFKSYNEYLEYKSLNKGDVKVGRTGTTILIIGVAYVVISLVLANIV